MNVAIDREREYVLSTEAATPVHPTFDASNFRHDGDILAVFFNQLGADLDVLDCLHGKEYIQSICDCKHKLTGNPKNVYTIL